MDIKAFRQTIPAGEWVLCQTCERCFLTGEEIIVGNDIWCGYKECLGNFYDVVDWNKLREVFPDLPEQPERDVRYDLSEYKRVK